tara:strand:- start:300 stop:2951 length:2652 start_codon:yes stop_codon:yes gene_type:complete
MANLKEFLDNIKPIKFWHIKDTYYFLQSVGNHWFLKKYLVLYDVFLVRNLKLTEEVRIEIRDNFLSFCNGFNDPKKKEAALKYFFEPVDYRYKTKILDFEQFNDLQDNDIATNLYFIRLLGIGGQEYEKKAIKEMLFKNKKYSEIFNSAKRLLDEANIERKKNNVKVTGEKATNSKIIRDQVGPIRNYRQTFTLWGFVPNEEDGYDLNDISKFIINSNDELFIAAMGDHQKFKMRLGRVEEELIYLDKIKKNKKEYRNPSKFFSQKNDFDDFNVFPSIALIEILNKLKNFTFDEFNYIINRVSPFKLEEVVSLINEVRKHKWPKSFNRKKDGGPNGGNGDTKQLQNFLYGYNLSKNPSKPNDPTFLIKEIINSSSVIQFSKGKVIIVNEEKFNYYYNFVLIIKKYLSNKYENLFLEFSKQYKENILIRLNELVIEKKVDDNAEYIKKMADLIKLSSSKNDFDDFKTISRWRDYINYVDHDLILLTYALNFCLVNFDKLKEDVSSVKVSFPQFLTSYYHKENFSKNIYMLVNAFFKKDKDFDLAKLKNYKLQVEENYIENSDLTKLYTVSEVEDIIDRDKKYKSVLFNKVEAPKRDNNLMIYAKNSRLKIIRKDFNPLKCDICPNQVKKITQLECHHIIDWKVRGPDDLLNYAMLCKSCHKKFSHDPNKEERINLINKLKLKNIINFQKWKTLVRERKIKRFHLDWLKSKKYIHEIQYLALRKLFDVEIYRKKNLKYESQSGISEKRWQRAMSLMKKKSSNICQGGCGRKNVHLETHHIIPKKQKFKRHGNIVLKGPESPFNYLFLCKACHQAFTFDKIFIQKKIIKHIVKEKIFTPDSVYQLILDDELNIDQLDFLKVDNYIDTKNYIWLQKVLEEKIRYKSN